MIFALITMGFCFICILFSLINRRYTGVIYNLIWLFGMQYVAQNTSYFSEKTFIILAIAIIGFNVGYFTPQVKKIRFTLTIKRKSSNNRGTNVILNRKLLDNLLLITTSILLFYSIRTIVSFGFDFNAIRNGNSSAGENTVYSSVVDTVLYYGIAGAGSYIFPCVAIYCHIKRIKLKVYEWIMIALIVMLSVVSSGGRMHLVRIAIYVMASMIWITYRNSKIKKISFKTAFTFGAVVMVLLSIITVSRNSADGTTFISQAFDYLFGSLAHMEYQIRSFEREGIYFGLITYGGFLYYPIKVLNLFLTTPLKTSAEMLVYLQKQVFLNISGSTMYYNALVPNAFYYYYDSGLVGCFLFSMVLGAACKIYERAENESFFRFYMFATTFYAVTFSMLGGIMWTFAVPVTIIFASMLGDKIFVSLSEYGQGDVVT